LSATLAAVRRFAWIGLLMIGCYDVDRLRAERDSPIVSDAGIPQADGAADANVCPPLPAPSNGLIAFYPLDETSGPKVNDCSGRGLDGVVLAADARWTPARNGGGVRLSPVDGCVQIATASGASALDFTRSFTVAAWVWVKTFPELAGYIVGKTRDPDLAGWRLASGQSGVISGAISLPTGVRLSVDAPIALETWLHVAMVVTAGGALELFVGGQLAASKAGAPNPLRADPPATARIGCRSDGTQSFDGIVDDVRIFDRALTAAEVATLAR
jgi:hypothetical protein